MSPSGAVEDLKCQINKRVDLALIHSAPKHRYEWQGHCIYHCIGVNESAAITNVSVPCLYTNFMGLPVFVKISKRHNPTGRLHIPCQLDPN